MTRQTPKQPKRQAPARQRGAAERRALRAAETTLARGMAAIFDACRCEDEREMRAYPDISLFIARCYILYTSTAGRERPQAHINNHIGGFDYVQDYRQARQP